MDSDLILHIVSHTHWDREWYMSFQKFRRRFVKLMDRLIDLLESRDDYKFFTLDGQVLVLKDYLEIRPENAGRIIRLVQEGRLLIGPWYSQPNDFMVSGEALIRNLMLGFRETKSNRITMKTRSSLRSLQENKEILKRFVFCLTRNRPEAMSK